MGFRTGAYARVWSIKPGTKVDGSAGNFSVGNITISKKNRRGEYEKDFQDGFVRFIGDAHEKIHGVNIPEKGITIKIGSCDVTNRYSVKNGKTYVNYMIFDFEFTDGNPSNTNAKQNQNKNQNQNDNFAAIEEDLPFFD